MVFVFLSHRDVASSAELHSLPGLAQSDLTNALHFVSSCWLPCSYVCASLAPKRRLCHRSRIFNCGLKGKPLFP